MLCYLLRFLSPLGMVVGLLCVPARGVEFPAVQPTTGVIHRWVALPATLAPFQQVDLCARVAGYVKTVAVDRGDIVKAGQLLAQIEVPEIEADLVKMKSEQEAADIELKRLREAQAKSPDLVLPQTVDNANARFQAAKANVDRCLTMLEFAQIKAPFAGTITRRLVDPGAHVAAGSGVLFHLLDATKIRCQVSVTELETPLAVEGKPVKVVLDAFPGKTIEAALTRVSRALDPHTRTMLVEADLENPGGEILPGMSGTARIAVERHESAVLVPSAAVVMEKTNAFVFKHTEGKAVKTPVKIGFNDGNQCEVPELKAGDVLLVPGSLIPTDGQSVVVRPASQIR
jgi:membrane fusion protein (multidrug efflux system)